MGAGDGKNKAKPSGQKSTNTTLGSVANVAHSEPTVTLYGREAGTFKVGDFKSSIGRIVSPTAPSLHFTVIIDDGYTGIFGIDGQPTTERNFDLASDYLINKNLMKIKTQFYRQEPPTGIVIKINIDPPAGMSRQKFAQELVKRAYTFASYSSEYSFPVWLGGSTMDKGEYNSSSYVAGLLNSVMGYVPKISTPGYQTPGWENPIPYHFFKGEALR